MSRNLHLQSRIVQHLKRLGPSKAKEIYQGMGISQAVFSRLVTTLEDEILVRGRARGTSYAAKREIPGIGRGGVSLYAINEDGDSQKVGHIYGIWPQGYWVESLAPQLMSRRYDDLPYFLYDLKPTGYLGRLIAQEVHELGLPRDCELWNGDHSLLYFSVHGVQLPGQFIVGDHALSHHNHSMNEQRHNLATKEDYPQIANTLLHQLSVGSSAGGEQPKFLSRRKSDNKDVLVKFSPPVNTEVGRRWADLLVCEHLAHKLLNQHNFKAANSQIIEAQGRVFLEIERFDRVGDAVKDAAGRIGVISLLALDLEFVGSTMDSWGETAVELHRSQRIDADSLLQIRQLEFFGSLIANTDMHLGNLSFLCDAEDLRQLAPVYDMLPMFFAPRHGQIWHSDFEPPSPAEASQDTISIITSIALRYWERVANCSDISAGFRKIASACAHKLALH